MPLADPSPAWFQQRPQCLPSQETAQNASWPTNHGIDWRFSVVLSKWLASSSLTKLRRACIRTKLELHSRRNSDLRRPTSHETAAPTCEQNPKNIAESLRHPISFSLLPQFDIDRLPPNGGTSPRGDGTAKHNNDDQPPYGRLFHDLTTLHDFERLVF